MLLAAGRPALLSVTRAWPLAHCPGCTLSLGSTGLSCPLHGSFPSRTPQERLGLSRFNPLWACTRRPSPPSPPGPHPQQGRGHSALRGVCAQWQWSTSTRRRPAGPVERDPAWSPGHLCPLHLPPGLLGSSVTRGDLISCHQLEVGRAGEEKPALVN